jgi:hypothetical protein
LKRLAKGSKGRYLFTEGTETGPNATTLRKIISKAGVIRARDENGDQANRYILRE